MKRLFLMAAAVALSACAASSPLVPASQPHGVVVMHNTVGVGDTHPAYVASIDGINVHGEQRSFALAPGEHTLRVVGLLNRAHLRSPVHDLPYTRTRDLTRYDLKLTVEEGYRYTIAAHFNGPTANDWEPVILRTEPITR